MFAAGTATKTVNSFDPRALGSCALWLDAADANTITFSSGSNIATWKDKGPSGLTFAPGQSGAVSTAAPTYNATNKFVYFNNGYSAILGSGSQGLQATTNWSLPAYTEAKTAYIVLNILNGTNGSYNSAFRAYRNLSCNAPNSFFSIEFTATNPATFNSIGEQYNYVSGAWQRAIATSFTTPSTNSTIIGSYVSTRASTNMFLSGILAGSNTTSYTPTVNGSQIVNEISVGAGYDSRVFTGYLYEVLYFNAEHNNAQRQAVEGYLAWKWGQTNALPTGHPYKTTFPVLRPLNPNDMSTMPILWFDAANLGTIASNTSNVTTWSNQGTLSNNAISNVAGSNTLRTGQATQNGLNVLSVPANGHLSIPATIFTQQDRSIFISFKLTTSIDSTDISPFTSSNTVGNGMAVLFYGLAGPVYRYALSRFGIGDLVMFDTGTNPLNNFYQVAFVQSGTTTASNAASWNGSTMGLSANAVASYTNTEAYNIAQFQRTVTFTLGDIIIYNTVLGQSERQQIEGYQAWKWGIQSLMPTNHPYYYSMPMTVKFNPRFLSNCLFWFDAADLATISSNTSNITTWSNKGIAQVNALSNASYTTGRTGVNTINGLNAVNFIAGASVTVSNISTPNQARTVFVVTRNLTELNSGTTFQGYFNAGSAGGAGWQDFYMAYTGGQYVLNMGKNGTGFYVGFNVPTNPLNTVNMYGLVNSTSSASNAATYNGSTMTLTTSSNAASYLTTQVPFAILASPGYNTAQDMGEFIQYDYALTPSERYRVEGYLAWKWGLASSLPNNHPFKKFAP